jgi:tetratricopeptide (TPR) repeat protein
MDDNLQNQISLHSAGATVRHLSSFDHLDSYRNDFELSSEFITKWVRPFYMNIRNLDDTSWIEHIKQLTPEITEEVTLALLGDFNWRTRLVGAYLSAVKNYENQIDIIGVHLLKSEVCCVGDLYAIVLAFYNNAKSNQYLNMYLEYYLHKPKLYFDQERVLEAVIYLDSINSTDHLLEHIDHWKDMLKKREVISNISNNQIAKMLEELQGKEKAEEYLNAVKNITFQYNLNNKYISKQIEILKELREYSS